MSDNTLGGGPSSDWQLVLYPGERLSRYAKPITKCYTATKATIDVTTSVYRNVSKWWRGEITGARCAKSITDDMASIIGGLAGGVAGTAAGAAAGSLLAPGPGTVIGGFVGGIAASLSCARISHYLCSLLSSKIFGLQQDAALDRAHQFLHLSHTATNEQVNQRRRQLLRKYHPDKGGSEEDFIMLESYVSLIKAARDT